MRLLVATLLAVAIAAPAAHAGRPLTRLEAAEIQVLRARANAGRVVKTERPESKAEKKKRIRDAKMAEAIKMAIAYKAAKAKKKADREKAKKAEETRRQHLLHEILRLRAFERAGR